MNLFDLPVSTVVDRVVPKNAFDAYTNSKQKKAFSDLITRIRWTHKISSETVNLSASDIQEIQLFKVEVKVKKDIDPLLLIIDKAIPYTLVFYVTLNDEFYLYTSKKHTHPTKQDTSVIDWVFRSEWLNTKENKITFKLSKSIDAVYKDLCLRIVQKEELSEKPLEEIIVKEQEFAALEKQIAYIQSSMKRTKQFNKKVELNSKLKALQQELKLKSSTNSSTQ